jgi:pimeloyl-ACP methyl ester carboxylesterase
VAQQLPGDRRATWRRIDGLAVYRVGLGPPVLVMPGPHRYSRPGVGSFDVLVDGVTRLGRSVVTFDPPGSGLSPGPARLGMDEMLHCADLAIGAEAGAAPVDAVGHSMAGLVLLAYALRRPERVRRLVLIGTGAGGPAYTRAPGALWNRTHPDFWGMATVGVLHIVWPTRGSERLMNNYIARRSVRDARHASVDRITASDWFRRRLGRPDWHRIARRLDYSTRLAEITAPTLVLCGRHDPQFPPMSSRQLAAGIDGAALVWFDHSGHYPHVEEPDAFWSAVDGFLAAGVAGARPRG